MCSGCAGDAEEETVGVNWACLIMSGTSTNSGPTREVTGGSDSSSTREVIGSSGSGPTREVTGGSVVTSSSVGACGVCGLDSGQFVASSATSGLTGITLAGLHEALISSHVLVNTYLQMNKMQHQTSCHFHQQFSGRKRLVFLECKYYT